MQIGKPFVVAKLKDYPQFQSVALAIEKSGFKVCTVTNTSFNLFVLTLFLLETYECDKPNIDMLAAPARSSSPLQHVELPLICNANSARPILAFFLVRDDGKSNLIHLSRITCLIVR